METICTGLNVYQISLEYKQRHDLHSSDRDCGDMLQEQVTNKRSDYGTSLTPPLFIRVSIRLISFLLSRLGEGLAVFYGHFSGIG